MSPNPLLKSTKKYARELGYDLPDMFVCSVRAFMVHAYCIWKTLRNELGPDKGYELYHDVIEKLMPATVSGAAARLGITEVKDLPTLGRLVERGSLDFPLLYETVTSTPDVYVGRVLWCVNPHYGPCRNYLDRQAYFRHERDVTLDPYLSG